MTPQAKALRTAVAAAVGPGKVDAALRAVVEELGVTERRVREVASIACSDPNCIDCGGALELSDALAALLEASGGDHG